MKSSFIIHSSASFMESLKEVGAGTGVEATEECCLLLAPPGWFTLLSHAPQDRLPRNDHIHGGLGPLSDSH